MKPGVLPYVFPVLQRPLGRQRLVAGDRSRARRGLRVPRRDPADAPLRARCGDRHVRRARDHPQHPHATGADRARGRRRSRLSPRRPNLLQATLGAIAVIASPCSTSAAASGGSSALRARTRSPRRRAGIDIHRQRLWAFTLSGALAGFAGGLLVHFHGTHQDRRRLPRPDVPDPGDARRRRLSQPRSARSSARWSSAASTRSCYARTPSQLASTSPTKITRLGGRRLMASARLAPRAPDLRPSGLPRGDLRASRLRRRPAGRAGLVR